MKMPTKEELIPVLDDAWKAHSEYQGNYLEGVRDPVWAGWYAGFVIGRLGDFTTPTRLTRLLEDTETFEDWSGRAAAYILESLG